MNSDNTNNNPQQVQPEEQVNQLLMQTQIQQTTINNLMHQNSELYQTNYNTSKIVSAMENRVKKLQDKNEVKYRLPSFLIEDTASGILVLFTNDGKVHEATANGIVTETLITKYSPYCNRETEYTFKLKLINDETIREVRIPDSLFDAKYVLNEFRKQGNMVFWGNRSEKKTGEFLCNYLVPKIKSGKTVHVPFHHGWTLENGLHKFLIRDGNAPNNPSTCPFVDRKLEKCSENLSMYELTKYLHKQLFEPFKLESIKIAVILYIWMHFTIMQTLFKEENITVSRILALTGDKELCLGAAKKIGYFTKPQKTVPIDATIERIKREILESKDESIIFVDNEDYADDTKSKIDKIKTSKNFIANMFCGNGSFQMYFDVEKVTYDIETCSNAIVVTNTMFYEIEAEKFLKLHIGTDDVDLASIKFLDSNYLPQYVMEFVEVLEENMPIVKNTIKQSYFRYISDNSLDFEKRSSIEMYAVFMATLEIIKKFHKNINFNSKEVVDIDIEQAIASVLLEQEMSYDMEGATELFRELLLESINSGEINLIDNNKTTADRFLEVDTQAFNIYCDDNYYCITLATLEKFIMAKVKLPINLITILSSLDADGAIKVYRSKQSSYERKVTIYSGRNIRETKPRMNMVVIERSFIEELGSIPYS